MRGQEGRLWLSKHPPLYLYYVFSTPGLVQRQAGAAFPFPVNTGPCLLFPLRSLSRLSPPPPPNPPPSAPPPCTDDNALVSGEAGPAQACAGSRAGRSQREVGGCAIVSASPVFRRGSEIQGGIAERTMARGPWRKRLMKATFPPPPLRAQQRHPSLFFSFSDGQQPLFSSHP